MSSYHYAAPSEGHSLLPATETFILRPAARELPARIHHGSQYLTRNAARMRRGRSMDDVVARQSASETRPRLDLQEHLADLEAEGLLLRIDHPVDKDTELHPLVRLQFIGGIPEAERRAFLFTHVVDSAGKRYDIPVAVGAIAASAEIYALGMGCAVDEIGQAWLDAINHPVAPVRVTVAPCQE